MTMPSRWIPPDERFWEAIPEHLHRKLRELLDNARRSVFNDPERLIEIAADEAAGCIKWRMVSGDSLQACLWFVERAETGFQLLIDCADWMLMDEDQREAERCDHARRAYISEMERRPATDWQLEALGHPTIRPKSAWAAAMILADRMAGYTTPGSNGVCSAPAPAVIHEIPANPVTAEPVSCRRGTEPPFNAVEIAWMRSPIQRSHLASDLAEWAQKLARAGRSIETITALLRWKANVSAAKFAIPEDEALRAIDVALELIKGSEAAA